ncbi:MAG: hypothetical protein K8T90_13495 [Planctomycetes bacterium]|nr:hypothetical protein [Planctomycetota bacterium]
MSSPEDAGDVVMAVYRPKAGKDAEVRAIIADHVPTLRACGLATARPVALLQASDGTYVEIFEWVRGGADRAHSDPRVLSLWGKFAEVCEFLPLTALPGADRPFPHFRAVEGVTV